MEKKIFVLWWLAKEVRFDLLLGVYNNIFYYNIELFLLSVLFRLHYFLIKKITFYVTSDVICTII